MNKVKENLLQLNNHIIKPLKTGMDAKEYEITNSVVLANGGLMLSKGIRLKECIDGWYRVFLYDGREMYFRLHAKAVEDITEKNRVFNN